MNLKNYPGDLGPIITESQKLFKYEEIEHFISYAFNIKDGDDDVDLYGKSMKDYPNLEVYYLPIYDVNEGIRTEIKNFQNLITLSENLIGVSRCQIIFVGPGSEVPWHTDGMYATEEERLAATQCNIIMPIFISSSDSAVVGLQIDKTIVSMDKPMVLNNSIPHYAWNFSDKWWVMLICYTDKGVFNL